MTRINADLTPLILTDQHLLAEYNEIGLFYSSLRRSIKSKNGLNINVIPKEFTLNSGHVIFFYDKLTFIETRYDALKVELRKRNFNLDENRRIFDINEFPRHLYNDWKGNRTSNSIIKERISLRIRQKPTFYRYYREKINPEEFIERHY